jgi:hypothetical protein
MSDVPSPADEVSGLDGSSPEASPPAKPSGCGCLAAILLIGILFGACSYFSDDDSTPRRADRTITVTAAEYGDEWPLTVDSGVLQCQGNAASIRTPRGVYALNGFALQEGLPRLDPIWRDDPSVPGVKVSIGDLLDMALALC